MVTPCWCCWRTWMRLPTLTGYAGRSFVNCSSNENLYHPPKSPLRWTCSSSHFMWVQQVLRYYCVIVTCNWLAQKYKKKKINKRFSNRNQNSEITQNHGTMTAGIFVDSICMWMCRIGTYKMKFYTILPLMSVCCVLSRYPLSSKQADWLPYCREVGWQWLGVTSVLYIGLFFAFVLVKERFHSSLCCIYVTRGCGQIKARRIKGFVDNKMPRNMYLVESLRLSFTENQTQPDRHEAPRQEQ